ncbi:MAG: hypothetical protein LBF16_04660, partial [Pseudomonadales bacterium]|nr:hypothetical protein [Pseudomonadales bacterium]
MNLSYSTEQDRLLFKAREENDTEYRVWLTRRFTTLLLKFLRERMAALGGQEQLAASPQTVDQLKSGAFQQPYRAPSPAAPAQPSNQDTAPAQLLGHDGILAYRLNYSFAANDMTRV